MVCRLSNGISHAPVEPEAFVRAKASIGIDVGGTKTLAALFDDDFEVIDENKDPTPQREQDFADLLIGSVRALRKKAAKNG